MTGTIRELRPENPALEDVLEAVAAAASALGIEAYLVGGFVRDRLLGGPPSKDIDLVTVGVDPMPLLAAVAADSAGTRRSASSGSAPRRSAARAL